MSQKYLGYRTDRDLICTQAMQGIAEPAQWVKAVEELEESLQHEKVCKDCAEDGCDRCSECNADSVLAKLTAARTGGKE